MVVARIKYKDGTEEPMEFKSFWDYGRFIDENAGKIREAWANHVRPLEIRQGRENK